jgi:hypothetical protein
LLLLPQNFDPLVGKRAAVLASNRILDWIHQEEESLFMSNTNNVWP